MRELRLSLVARGVFDWHVEAWGLMPLALILGVIYVRGWRNWAPVPLRHELVAEPGLDPI